MEGRSMKGEVLAPFFLCTTRNRTHGDPTGYDDDCDYQNGYFARLPLRSSSTAVSGLTVWERDEGGVFHSLIIKFSFFLKWRCHWKVTAKNIAMNNSLCLVSHYFVFFMSY